LKIKINQENKKLAIKIMKIKFDKKLNEIKCREMKLKNNQENDKKKTAIKIMKIKLDKINKIK
jgi:hypothetical protein